MKAKIKIIFPAAERGRATWPYINYDVENRAKEVIGILRKNLSDNDVFISKKRKEKDGKAYLYKG